MECKTARSLTDLLGLSLHNFQTANFYHSENYVFPSVYSGISNFCPAHIGVAREGTKRP